jgi:hypothetical protein
MIFPENHPCFETEKNLHNEFQSSTSILRNITNQLSRDCEEMKTSSAPRYSLGNWSLSTIDTIKKLTNKHDKIIIKLLSFYQTELLKYKGNEHCALCGPYDIMYHDPYTITLKEQYTEILLDHLFQIRDRLGEYITRDQNCKHNELTF